jgi:hypothetical protein
MQSKSYQGYHARHATAQAVATAESRRAEIMKALVLVLVILFAAIGALWLTGSDGPSDAAGKHAGERSAPSKFSKGSLGSDAVLAIAPGRVANSNASSAAKPMAATLQEFYKTRSYAPLYARLKDSKTRTPEESWMLAEILARCAKVDGEAARGANEALGSPGARERFVASIAPNDPDRDKRLAAFDAINYNQCAELGELTVTRHDIRALHEAGAAGGDPKARVALVGDQLDDSIRGPDGKERPNAAFHITDAQLETLRQAIASGDPLAMRSAGTTLMLPFDNMSLRDADDLPLDFRAFIRANILVTCDYGLPCGSDADWIAHACAARGDCAAGTLRDHMMFYNSSPSSSQLMASYEAALRNAARDGNWSFFHFSPAPNPATAIQYPGP